MHDEHVRHVGILLLGFVDVNVLHVGSGGVRPDCIILSINFYTNGSNTSNMRVHSHCVEYISNSTQLIIDQSHQ